jgi:lysophospholipase L1-like esterase
MAGARSRLAVGLLALAALTLAAADASAAPPAPGSTYVALGSSYAAGTRLPREAEDSPASCGQGTENYPRQVARALSLKLVDRSCGGATTTHILQGGQFGLPAQVAAVDGQTKLVTMTIGGNDVRFTADLGLFSCRRRSAAEQAAPCSEPPPNFQLDRAFLDLEANLRAVAALVRNRAPQARLMFVDYITVVPPAGSCASLGLSAAEASLMRERAARLSALTAKVAAETGADLIQASKLTESHDVCSPEPWAWGFVSAAERTQSGAVGFHPRPEAIVAVAQAIVQRLER